LRTDGNHIYFEGKVQGDPPPCTAALYNIAQKQGYQDITLDFSDATFLAAEFMIPIITICRSYRSDKVDFEIILPNDRSTANLLKNTNWAHIICPEKFESNADRNINHLSARQFLNSDQHYTVVDDSISVILQSVPGIDRSRLKALEWALNEITDNVLNHSESSIGGIVQVMTFPKRRRVDFYVCDAGITIPKSLRSGRSELMDDTSALRAAIEEGVTRNKNTNQGNGLFGTFKCCEVSGGEFDTISGNVSLRARPGDLRVLRTQIPFSGTYVRASIGYDFEKLLEKALVFKRKAHEPSFDYIGRIYHTSESSVTFNVQNEIKAFGSREAGRLARTKIENLMDSGRVSIDFDFSDIKLISSSFADEVFGKLFVSLGAVRFGQLCNFKSVDPTVQALIDRAISQRVKG
jgi:hypothetical protein